MAHSKFCTISSACCQLAWISIALIGFQFVTSADPNPDNEEITESFITQSTPSQIGEVEEGTTVEEFSSVQPTSSTQFPDTTSYPSPSSSPDSSCRCGVRTDRSSLPSGKIIGGTPILEGNDDWPWFAAMVRIDRPTKAHCGASLISPQYLLTAAHCLLPMMQIGLRNFKVSLGTNDLENPDYGFVQASIESVTVHPKLEPSYPFYYDIGLVRLSSSVNCSRKLRPICLPHDETSISFLKSNHANFKALTSGFGKTTMNGNYSGQLHQIQLDLVPKEECRRKFSKLSYPGPPILDNMLCAWGKGKDSCVGDSGGPLIVQNQNKAKKWEGRIDQSMYNKNEPSFTQVGVTSWGIGCANEKYPGVYTKVDKYLSWIKSIVSDLQ